MYLRTFAFGLGWRIALMVALITGLVYAWADVKYTALSVTLGIGLVWSIVNLYNYVNVTNRKLVRFLESVRYDDFSVRFASTNQLDPTFRELSRQFNEVLDAFRQVRADKETSSQYLQTIVQHVGTGLLAFDENGQVEIANSAALKLLDLYRLKTLNDLDEDKPELKSILLGLKSGESTLYQAAPDRQLAISSTSLRMRGLLIRLVAIQNIQSELENKELEAWQNLTRVLRHEIMNSVTPITSLVSTMREIIQSELDDANHQGQQRETWQDLNEALEVIESRTLGLMHFVNAYRTFTSIPKPVMNEAPILPLIQRTVSLFQPTLRARNITLESSVEPLDLSAQMDVEQIEQVLINLLKNAVEILENRPSGKIWIKAYLFNGAQRPVIEIIDNGPGIEPEALEQIFIPFYTTKEDGTGVGLSLSRQILQMHGGALSAESQVGQGAKFTLLFK
jgi:two-component system, NtrC family, nitrogen regulation sensor histidine kinase NtrY